MKLDLSDRQKQTVAAAITILSAVVIILAALALFMLLVRFFSFFSTVFMPLFVALILALLMRPAYEFFRARLKAPPVLAVTFVYLSVLAPTAIIVAIFGAFVVSQASELIGKLPEVVERARSSMESNWPQIKAIWDRYGLTEKAQVFLSEQAGVLWEAFRRAIGSAATAGASAFRTVAAGLGWFVLPVYLAFFLMAPPIPRKQLGNHLPFLKEKTRDDVVYLVDQFITIIVSFFRGQLIVAVGQGLLFAIGFALVGLRYGFVIGLVLGGLNLIPYLGSMIGLAVALPLAFLQPGGGPLRVVLVLLVFVVVQLIEGYLLTPKVMGDRTGLHPLTIMVGLFFWGTAFDGLTGMILAIPLTAFLVVFWRLAKAKYITEIV